MELWEPQPRYRWAGQGVGLTAAQDIEEHPNRRGREGEREGGREGDMKEEGREGMSTAKKSIVTVGIRKNILYRTFGYLCINKSSQK